MFECFLTVHMNSPFILSAATIDLTNKANVDYSDTKCNSDYVLIPGGSLTGLNQDKRFSLDRFCGTTLGVCGTTTSTEQTCGEIPGPVTSKLKKYIKKPRKNSKTKQKNIKSYWKVNYNRM